MRTRIPLNFDWQYQENFTADMLHPDFPDTAFQRVDVPHTVRELPFSHFDETICGQVCCYRKRMNLDPSHAGKRLRLHFEGVMAAAEVYLNGQLAGGHKGGYTPFCIDLTAMLRVGVDNLLAIRVDTREDPGIPPFGGVVDYLTYGGIYREVWLEVLDPVAIVSMKIGTFRLVEQEWRTDLTLFWENTMNRALPVHLRASLTPLPPAHQDPAGVAAAGPARSTTVLDVPFLVPADDAGTSTHAFVARDVRPWQLDMPQLYELSVCVEPAAGHERDAGAMTLPDGYLDRMESVFGYREAVFKPNGFFLNGSPVKLRGLNRHQSYPHVGYAMPESVQRQDADILKHQLGVNLVRSSHYPPSRHFLDRCDEIGLLVFEEIPGWQHIGDEAWKQVALADTEAMIRRDWNHPSVILWGVRINESQDDDDFYRETNRLAHALDDTRQTGGVRNFAGSRLFEDVYTFNDFIHHGTSVALQRPNRIRRQARRSGQATPSIKERRSVRTPYLVTEHNGHMFPTKTTDPEARRTEHALRHLRVLDAMYRHRHITGAIGWCMADYNTHRDFGSGDRICHHGVLDMYRLPKTAAAVYASQQDDQPFLFVSSTMNIGDHDAASLPEVSVFTNCDAVVLYRNEEPIGTFLPDRRRYRGVPHPPVIIRDFVGDRLERQEGFSHRNAEGLKRVMRQVMATGGALSLRVRLAMGWQMLKNRLSYERAVQLFGEYMGNWGGKSVAWRFEGIRDGLPACSANAGAAPDGGLQVVPDKHTLTQGETWDACRLVIRHVDGWGQPCTYSRETVHIRVSGTGRLLGPSCLALTGGGAAFWVRTTGQAGEVRVQVDSERYGTTEVRMQAT